MQSVSISLIDQYRKKNHNIPYYSLLVTPKFCISIKCFQFHLEPFWLETEDMNAYAKFWSDKQRVLWYVMVFSVVVNTDTSWN